MEKHLWEYNHPWYFSDSAYHSTEEETLIRFNRFSEFSSYAQTNHFKLDQLLIRWDWSIIKHYKDPYYFDGELSLFFVMYRKGLYHVIKIQVCKKDEDDVKQFLKQQLEVLKSNWEPIWE